MRVAVVTPGQSKGAILLLALAQQLGLKSQSSMASSWSARSSNMLLMSSRMFLAK